MASRVVTFGEVMLRLSPPSHQRIAQATSFDASFGGGEANVAVSLAQWGIDSRFVTALPANPLGDACLNTLRGYGVDTSRIARSGSRLGVYFLEHGASQRPSSVLYDRAGSSTATADPKAFDWGAIFADADWFHFTGITPALSPQCLEAVREAASVARAKGLTVSCDLNYRSKLWSRSDAQRTMSDLMKHVNVCIANEEDAGAVFGISGGDVNSGLLDGERYENVARQLTERFEFDAVAITLRESRSASRNGWRGMLFREGRPHFSRRYDIDVVDRVGSGDAFAAGLICAMLDNQEAEDAIEFAAAAGCLKHSIHGDFNLATLAEVEALAKGGGSGRVVR